MRKTIFLISGKARSGKNTLADFLCAEVKSIDNSGVVYNIADILKTYSERDFGALSCFLGDIADDIDCRTNILFGFNSGNKLNNFLNNINSLTSQLRIKHENWHDNKTKLSRILLQTYGTNIFRNRVDEDFWCKKFKDRIDNTNVDYIFVADVRFKSEIDYLSDSDDYETYTIRINRKGIVSGDHPSEIDLDNYPHFNYIVENDGSLEDLRGSAKEIFKDILDSKLLMKLN
jgi:hypothetical protein